MKPKLLEDLYAEAKQSTKVGRMNAPMGVVAEKFAELIVRECAKLVEDNIDPQNAWITPAFIKEHFGVEE